MEFARSTFRAALPIFNIASFSLSELIDFFLGLRVLFNVALLCTPLGSAID
jgi:hypothetical protein